MESEEFDVSNSSLFSSPFRPLSETPVAEAIAELGPIFQRFQDVERSVSLLHFFPIVSFPLLVLSCFVPFPKRKLPSPSPQQGQSACFFEDDNHVKRTPPGPPEKSATMKEEQALLAIAFRPLAQLGHASIVGRDGRPSSLMGGQTEIEGKVQQVNSLLAVFTAWGGNQLDEPAVKPPSLLPPSHKPRLASITPRRTQTHQGFFPSVLVLLFFRPFFLSFHPVPSCTSSALQRLDRIQSFFMQNSGSRKDGFLLFHTFSGPRLTSALREACQLFRESGEKPDLRETCGNRPRMPSLNNS